MHPDKGNGMCKVAPVLFSSMYSPLRALNSADPQAPHSDSESVILGGSQESAFHGLSAEACTLHPETMAAVVLGVPGWEELSCSRRGPRPCDLCPKNTPQAPLFFPSVPIMLALQG